ncbi:MAG: YeeE/YedE family protein [Azonexaceae bacterium]|nr:YeeE/YedE family protein [Azonexaceae bacterium]
MIIDWNHFSPWSALTGGALIGLAASLLLLANGRIAGVSGILGGLLRLDENDTPWQAAFVAGLLFAPALWAILMPGGLPLPSFTPEDGAGWGALILGGLLVGIGTRLANGCTSGHGVCGLARLSVRSLAAVLVFMAFGFLTVFVVRHILGN